MYELKKKIGKVFTSKFVWTGPSSYGKRIYQAAVSQRLIKTALHRPQLKVLVIVFELLERNTALECSGYIQLRVIMPGSIDNFWIRLVVTRGIRFRLAMQLSEKYV